MDKITLVSSYKCYEGFQKVYHHFSEELKCEMNFSIYLPPQAEAKKCPVLFWLSGLTCTEQNFIIKSGFQRHAARHGIIVVGPDTSPRGCNIDGEDVDYDFGTGAGFYCDATEPKWSTNYRMYSYVTKELPSLIKESFPVNGKTSIFGHSMGGHGAITCALKNPTKYLSISAFSPVSNPTVTPWGKKALVGYLGSNQSTWKEYDSTLLAREYKGPEMEILIHQGTGDCYLKDELKPENFVEACKGTNIKPTLVMKEGYDHSFYFISTFLEDHFDYHAKFLCQ